MNDQFTKTTEPTGATGPVVYPATGIERAPSPWRLTTVVLLLTLIAGLVGGGWLVNYYWQGSTSPEKAMAGGEPTITAATSPATGVPATAAEALPAAIAVPVTVAQPTELSARIAALEERLARISVAADSASGNAAKAESILVAFAARRAIDRGLSLGAMEAQVRLRFGESQPNAVQSILSATARPVLQEDLIQRLESLRPSLLADGEANIMSRIGDSLSTLIVLRRAEAPSQVPTRKFERAQRALASGRLDVAIIEVEGMPGGRSPAAQSWLTDARRLNDARRALDLIEAAAIIEPAGVRDRPQN